MPWKGTYNLPGKYNNFLCYLVRAIFKCRISANSFLPWIVTPFNSFRSIYSIYEVKNCHNAENIWKFPHFPLSTKNSFLEIQYLLLFSQVSWNNDEMNIPKGIEPHRSRSHRFQIQQSRILGVLLNERFTVKLSNY